MAVLLLIVIIGAGYLVSLRIHPLRKCPTCKMTGRHFGSVYKGSYRRCSRCDGSADGLSCAAKSLLASAIISSV